MREISGKTDPVFAPYRSAKGFLSRVTTGVVVHSSLINQLRYLMWRLGVLFAWVKPCAIALGVVWLGEDAIGELINQQSIVNISNVFRI